MSLVCRAWSHVILQYTHKFTLLYAINRLPSPPRVVPVGAHIVGLRTPLYGYQLQTLQAMLNKEAHASTADSAAVRKSSSCFRIQPAGPSTGAGGTVQEGGGGPELVALDQAKQEGLGDAGGILGEDMGTGKTLVCLVCAVLCPVPFVGLVNVPRIRSAVGVLHCMCMYVTPGGSRVLSICPTFPPPCVAPCM